MSLEPVSDLNLEIRLFGPMEVKVEGKPLPPLRSRKVYWLLALLALRRGREVDRSWLAGTLWPDCTESQSYSSLRRSLWDLRNAMGGAEKYVASPSPRTLIFTGTETSVDAAQFDACVSEGDMESLRTAVSLYTGPLLEGCMEEWISLERELREQKYLDSLERLATLESSAGNFSAAADYLRRVIAVDQLREGAYRDLMKAQAAGGNFGAASLSYRDLRLRLRSEIGADPSPETAETYAAVKSSARALLERTRDRTATAQTLTIRPFPIADAPATELPIPITPIVGREQELTEITAVLEKSRFVTLLGPGGVGKTRLALEICSRLKHAFPDGTWFVDLSPIIMADAIPHAVCLALGVNEPAGGSLEAALRARLRGSGALIVLDNCEQLTDGCAQFSNLLLHACPQLKILATSRHAIGVHDEATWRVPSLSLPKRYGDKAESESPASLLRHSDAIRLFSDRALASSPSFRLTEENAAAVVQICARLDGIPLAIELAAARLNVLSPNQIAERLDRRFKLLTTGAASALRRHQTLREALDWSYNLLEPAERRMLDNLSVFSGGFGLEDVHSVCGESFQDEIESVDLIAGLVNKSMISVDSTGGAARYRLLETTREYCLERLQERGNEKELRNKHADWFLIFAEEARSQILGPDSSNVLASLDRAKDNLYAALDWLLQQSSDPESAEHAMRLVAALCGYWSARGFFADSKSWIQRALELDTPHSTSRAIVLLFAAHVAIRRDDRMRAEPLINEAESIYTKLDNRIGMAKALNARGRLADVMGEYSSARDLHIKALEIADELGDKPLIAASLLNLGLASYGMGEFESAWKYHQMCLDHTQAMGERAGVGWSLDNLGDTALAVGNVNEAWELYCRSLQVFKEVRGRHGIAACLVGLGRVEAAWGTERPGAASRVARLFGAAAALFNDMEMLQRPAERTDYERDLEASREFLGETAFERAWTLGQRMTLDDAIGYALSIPRDK